jgi:hypothetical protein
MNVETHPMFSVNFLISSQNAIEKAFPRFLWNAKSMWETKEKEKR